MSENHRPFPVYPERQPIFSGLTWNSQYVTVRDGTRLAVDVYLPKNLPSDFRLPTIFVQSRYWRAMEPRPPLNWFIDDVEDLLSMIGGMKKFFIKRGYALVYTDVRGTGASFGTLRYPWDPISLQDATDLLDWIISQPWSNGKVAGYGISYLGTTAELLLATRHPAVKAVIAMFNHPDPYVDVAFPGGVLNQRFVNDWSRMNEYLDKNVLPPEMGLLVRWAVRSCRPVGDDPALLAEALRDHEGNGNAFLIANDVTFRDEVEPEVEVSLDNLAVHSHSDAIRESQVPTYGWASWLDAGTAAAAIRRYLTYPNADHVTIGAWNHGGFLQASPYRSSRTPLSPPLDVQWREMLRFLDAYLLDIDNGVQEERGVSYYTLGAEIWQYSNTWPPSGFTTQRWYLSDQKTLSLTHSSEDNGEDHYLVDFEATSGKLNRWWELSITLNKSVEYPDRVEQGKRLLIYLAPPFENAVEVTGSPVVHLSVDCSTSDSVFIAYLEDVAPDGSVTYITEGVLRGLHRRQGSKPPYTVLGPYHTFKEADALPLKPGEPDEIIFAMQPVSVRIEPGHRLRLGLAGHDKGNFARIPAAGMPVWKILRNSDYASWLDIPVKML
jgi:putative CocE/NonD family hydrolase